jgi:uncharacterized protein (DUF983 family)
MIKRDRHTILATLARCLKLQCPVCGGESIVRRPFNLKHRCDACGAIFKREEGFFVGAIMANVVATEVFILITYLACLTLTNLSDSSILTILFVMAIAFPLAFYHHAWALWLGMDHFIEGLPMSDDSQHRPRKRM